MFECPERLHKVPNMYLFLELSIVIDLHALLLSNIQALTLALSRTPHLQIYAEHGADFVEAILD